MGTKLSKNTEPSLQQLYEAAMSDGQADEQVSFTWPRPTLRGVIEGAMIGIGVIMVMTSLAVTWWAPDTFISQQQVAEYDEAAQDFHALTSLPYGEADADQVVAARDRFEAARDAVASARRRRTLTERCISYNATPYH